MTQYNGVYTGVYETVQDRTCNQFTKMNSRMDTAALEPYSALPTSSQSKHFRHKAMVTILNGDRQKGMTMEGVPGLDDVEQQKPT
jgi:hypothetical protein